MAKQISKNTLNAILQIIENYPQGASLENILNAMNLPF
jgi:hypothetical protein